MGAKCKFGEGEGTYMWMDASRFVRVCDNESIRVSILILLLRRAFRAPGPEVEFQYDVDGTVLSGRHWNKAKTYTAWDTNEPGDENEPVRTFLEWTLYWRQRTYPFDSIIHIHTNYACIVVGSYEI